MWREADAPDGRKYYYHTVTQKTSWEKPADFDAPNGTNGATGGDWKEAKAADGRTYYYNTATNVTQWDKPAGYVSHESAPAPVQQQIERRDAFESLPAKPGLDVGRAGGSLPWERKPEGFSGAAPRADEPIYTSADEAETAFFKFLRSHEISFDADWRDVIKSVGREKGFRAVKDAGERRDAFAKYCREEEKNQAARETEQKAKRRDDFLAALRHHDEIKYYTRWKTARPALERETAFKNAKFEEERKQTFSDFRAELVKAHTEQQAAQRQEAMQALRELLTVLVTSSSTKWHDALAAIEANQRFKKDPLFRILSKLDILQIFENHVKSIDVHQNDKRQHEKSLKFRNERKARDAYKELLAEHVQNGTLKAYTSWQTFYPLIAKDQRYLDLVGASTSPLTYFWDVVDEQEQRVRSMRDDALDVLDAQRYEVTTNTTLEEFADVMSRDRKTSSISRSDLEVIFERIMEKVKRRHRDQQAASERGQQDAIDIFRQALRHEKPPFHPEDRYEDVVAKIDAIPASRVLSEDVKRSAFERHIRRLKEKPADREADRRREREHRNGSRRSYDNERERDRRHRTRSPEIDAYEADRRKAQADRERQYRKASFGLTPPPRERHDGRLEREPRRSDRYDNVYDREREERELQRERSYISRADPRDRGKVNALDYGDEDVVETKSSSSQKRRGSEGSISSKRDNKRARRDSSNVKTAAAEKEEIAMQSGSEEGEIEERNPARKQILNKHFHPQFRRRDENMGLRCEIKSSGSAAGKNAS